MRISDASRLAAALVGATSLSVLLAGCGKSAADLRADSVRAAAVTRAAEDSADARRNVVIDTAFAPELGIDLATMTHTESGLYIRDLAPGSGPAAESMSVLLVHYTTKDVGGKTLDATRKPGEQAGAPRRIALGRQQLLLAWEEGLRGMRAGGRRLIIAPPSMAYGIAGKPGSVPSLATLVFEIEVVQLLPR